MEELLKGPGLKPPPGVIPNFSSPPPQFESNIVASSLCLLIGTVANGIEIAYIPTIFIAKLSILLLLLRIFVPSGKTKTYWAIQAVILFNLLFYLANLPIEIWPCIPRRKLWNPLLPGHCINNEMVFVAGGAINMISDFLILLIPIVSIWRLKMPVKKRIGVCAIFATGIFIMHLATSVSSAKSKDKTYYLFPVALWTLAEITSAIVCGCLITMPNFFRHFAPKLVSRLSFSRYNNSRDSGSGRGSRKITALVPVRARPDQWGGYQSDEDTMKDKDIYMELGESNTWTTPTPAMVPQEGNDGMQFSKGSWRGGERNMFRPLAPLPANMLTVQTAVTEEFPRAE
ncbi:MAG: hypothetical protein Q9217_003714, partial [Psora testacea]